MGVVILIPFWLTIFLIYVLRYYYLIGFPTSYTLAPFWAASLPAWQRASRGWPGRHRVISGIEKILFLDKRPIQANFDGRVSLGRRRNRSVWIHLDRPGERCQEGALCFSNYNQVPAFITFCVTRGLLNRCQSIQLPAGRGAIREEMTSICQSRLAALGFEFSSFRPDSTQYRFSSAAAGQSSLITAAAASAAYRRREAAAPAAAGRAPPARSSLRESATCGPAPAARARLHLHGNVQLAFGLAAKDSVRRRHVGVIAADGGANVPVMRHQVVGRVEAHPAQMRHQHFDPCVRASGVERS